MLKSNRFIDCVLIGEGSYGKVIKCYDINLKRTVAIKYVKLEDPDGQEIPQTSLREMTILANTQHPNIIKLIEVLIDKHILMIFEYVESDMQKYFKSLVSTESRLSIAKSFLRQMLQGLDYLHNNNILHRDLKPQNILIDRNRRLYIADFGLSRYRAGNKMTLEIQSLWYRSPEVVFGLQKYSESLDIWGVFLMFYEMVERKVMFQAASEVDLIIKWLQLYGHPAYKDYSLLYDKSLYPHFKTAFPKYQKMKKSEMMAKYFTSAFWDESALDLLMRMGRLNPEERLCCKAALSHQFFQ